MNRTSLRQAHNSYRPWASPLFLMVAGVVSGYAQDYQPSTPPNAEPIIKVDVRLVVLHASVRNKAGVIVSALRKDSFKVFEDGAPQIVRDFRSDDTPVAVGLVVDHSGSMQRKMSDVVAAAVAFTRSANQEDELFTINFNERVTLGLPEITLFSSSTEELERALRRPLSGGRTALYDAIAAGLEHIDKSSKERKVLLVISDGKDNASKISLDTLLEKIWRSDAAIYTIGLFGEDGEDRNDRVLQRISEASGGERFLPATPANAVAICQSIAHDIRTQYTISYSPANQTFDGKHRSIGVTASDEKGRKLHVRTRTGYNASPPVAAGDKDDRR